MMEIATYRSMLLSNHFSLINIITAELKVLTYLTKMYALYVGLICFKCDMLVTYASPVINITDVKLPSL